MYESSVHMKGVRKNSQFVNSVTMRRSTASTGELPVIGATEKQP